MQGLVSNYLMSFLSRWAVRSFVGKAAFVPFLLMIVALWLFVGVIGWAFKPYKSL